MGNVLRYRREAPDEPRDRHDTGRVSVASRWFSGRTMRRAGRYRDVGWGSIIPHVLIAAALIVLSRQFPNEAFAPFALIAGAIWLALTARIAILKSVHAWIRSGRTKT